MTITSIRATAVGCLVLAAGMLTAACGAQSGTAGSAATAHQSIALASDVVYLTSNSGQSWTALHLPGHPANGHSVAVHGNNVAVITVDSQGLAYQHSADGGNTWQRVGVPMDTPSDTASVALSADGSQVAVLATEPSDAGELGVPALFVGPATGTLTARQAPASGDVEWTGKRLLLVGGALNSALFSSDDNGVTWAQHAVDGTLAPRFDVSPDAATLGAPMADTNGFVAMPVTTHGSPSVVEIERSTDGVTFGHGVRVQLAGDLGPGVQALVAAAGPNRFVVAEPDSTVLHVVDGASQTRFTAAGLTGPVDALAFLDAQHGIASVTTHPSCGDKSSCTGADTTTVFSTADGGHTWQAIG